MGHNRRKTRARTVEARPHGAPSVDLLPDGGVVIDWPRLTVILSAAEARQLTSRVLEAQLDGRDYFTKAGITRTWW